MARFEQYVSCNLQPYKVDDDDEWSDAACLRFGNDANEHIEFVVTSDFLRGLGQLIREADERKVKANAKRAARKAKR